MIKSNNFFTRSLIITFWVIIIFFILYISTIVPSKSSKDVINVFAWSGMFDLKYIAKFEEQTGIQVNFSYYESNAELLAKFRATKGRGYDLIVPSDYAVNLLREENLLAPLDKSKLDFMQKLNPILLNHYFDPNNLYSIPFEWSVFGLGIDREIIKVSNVDWSLVFEKSNIVSRIVMTNDPLVAIPIAAQYLWGSIENIDSLKLLQIKKLLQSQWSHVEAYTDFRPDYYIATKNAAVAVGSSSYFFRNMKHYKHMGFEIPISGSLVTIESFAIPIDSKKTESVYKFINFMLSDESVINSYKKFAFFPPTINIINKLDVSDEIRNLLNDFIDNFSKFKFFKLDNFMSPITEQDLQDLWVMIKR